MNAVKGTTKSMTGKSYIYCMQCYSYFGWLIAFQVLLLLSSEDMVVCICQIYPTDPQTVLWISFWGQPFNVGVNSPDKYKPETLI